jgi:hypothetical protein
MMWSPKYFTLCLIFFITGINAGSDIGVIGLGRTVFQPLCCYACLSSFWGLQLSCTPPQQAKHDIGSSPSCHSTNDPYLSSLAYCMQVKCAADSVSENEVEQCWDKVAGDGLQVSSLEDNLPISALQSWRIMLFRSPTRAWLMTSAMRIPGELFKAM